METKMKIRFVAAVMLLLLCGALFGQDYIMERSVIGAPGVPKEASGSYKMTEAAVVQTATKPVISTGLLSLCQGFVQINQIPIKFSANVFAGNDDIWVHTDLSSGNPVHVLYESFSNLSGGFPLCTSPAIYTGHDITLWIDEYADYSYSDLSDASIGTERWKAYSAGDDYAGTILNENYTNPLTSKSHEYFQQYKCDIDVQYVPDSPPAVAGYVNLVRWNKFNNDFSGFAEGINLFSDRDWTGTVIGPQWADGGSRLEFPEQTVGYSLEPWFTVNHRDWIVDKAIDKVMVYGQPINAELSASLIVWRNYMLMGVPLYPTQDTTYYKGYAGTHDCPLPLYPGSTSPGRMNRGDQDAVLYDDFDSYCRVAPATVDSNCGMYEDWWRVTKYYPSTGGYRRYRGPGLDYAGGSVEPFWPGRGFWLIQDHCGNVAIDVYGVKPDINDLIEIPLVGYETGYSPSAYNMCANPFYKGGGDDFSVFWDEAKIVDVTDPDAEDVKSIAEAVAASWIEPTIQTWRSACYFPISYLDAHSDVTSLKNWEGFWVVTKSGSADKDLVLRMKTHSGSRVRPSPGPELVEEWGIDFSVACPDLEMADNNNKIGFKQFADASVNIASTFVKELPDFCYPVQFLRTFFLDPDGGEFSEYYTNTRSAVIIWNGIIDARPVKGEKVAVKWDIENLPGGFALHLKDSDHDKWIDMISESEYTFIGTGKVHHIEIIANAPAEWVSKAVAPAAVVPEAFYLNSPMPNPFNASTRIEFGLSNADRGNVKVAVFDIMGRAVRTLVNGELEPGVYRYTWNGDDERGRSVSSGAYFIRFDGASRTITKKVSLIK